MKTYALPVALLLATSLVTPLSAQEQMALQPATNSAPIAPQLDDATPLPSDTAWPGGTISLDIDATDTLRGIYSVKETIPVPAGTRELNLLLPEWLPGNHQASGTIRLLTDIHFEAGGKTLKWSRNNLDVYEFKVEVPEGATEVVANFIHASPLTGSQGRITMTQEMLNLQWEKMSLYPAGHYTRRIAVKPTVTVPEGWTVFTALDGQTSSGNTVTWSTTDYETLVDSPIFAGKYAKRWSIGENVWLDTVADEPGDLELAPENLATFSKLIDEADALFGARHFDHYNFLLAMTDRMGGIGLEHHRSSENQYEPKTLVKWDEYDWDRNVVSHELVHSWDGKFRRPEGLWTPDYRTPMQDDLLWVYEGQTQFWGYILAARSGLQKKETILGALAGISALYTEGQPGREWRSVQDTTYDPIIASRASLPYDSLMRSEEYYTEGALVWLEADQIIRKGTGGKKGLDDFAKAFFGKTDGDWGVLTYDFDEVVATLNGIYAYDWASFLDTKLRQPNQPAPTKGVEMAGYTLAWKEEPNPYYAGITGDRGTQYLGYSLGFTLDKSGKVLATLWEGPAFKAGIVTGAEIVAVNGEDYTAERIKDAITAAKQTGTVQLVVKRNETVRTVDIPYSGGLRYPWLVKTAKGTAGLDTLLAPRTK